MINSRGSSLYQFANETKLADLQMDIGSTLKLTYDYGTTSSYEIKLVASDVLKDGDTAASFPRNQPLSGSIPTSYSKYQPDDSTDSLDGRFPDLNHWIFDTERSLSVNLFQPGRKKHFCFLDKNGQMLYLPMKPDSLANWLHCLNVGAGIKQAGVNEDGYAYYNWHSVVTILRSKVTPQLMISKYKSDEQRGFCDAPIVEDYVGTLNLEKTFPKIAALALTSFHIALEYQYTETWSTYKKLSATETRTQVTCVRGKYANHLHHSGFHQTDRKTIYYTLPQSTRPTI